MLDIWANFRSSFMLFHTVHHLQQLKLSKEGFDVSHTDHILNMLVEDTELKDRRQFAQVTNPLREF